MNIEELSTVLNYCLDNNLKLEENGLDKITYNICGNAGLGKTSLVKQIAEQRNAKFVKINLAEIEELGDLIGIPVKKYTIHNGTNERLVTEKELDYYFSLGYTLCEDCPPTMTYAIPNWVPEDSSIETIVLLDDFNRANLMFQQAIMSLIQFGEYISWKLPKKCQLLLSSNPDNEEYQTTALDSAQLSRFITFNIDFDVQPWAKWAELNNIREEFINFALLTPEIFTRSHIINSRSYTLFINSLSSLEDLSSVESLQFAQMLARATFGDDGDVIAGLYVQFINNNLHKLITPQEIVNQSWETVKNKLKDNVNKDGKYRPDIASVITTRLTNYGVKVLTKKDNKQEVTNLIDKVEKLFMATDKTSLIAEDLLLKLIKTLNQAAPAKMKKLVQKPEIFSKL